VLYLISAAVAVSVGLLVLAVASLLPSQRRPSKTRMVEMGLEGPFSKDAALRRTRVRNRVEDMLTFLGEKADTPRRNWGPLRSRLVHAGYRKPSALAVFLGLRIGAAGLLYFYGVFVGIGLRGSGGIAIVLGLVMGGLGWALPSFVLSKRVSKRQKQIRSALPDAVDLLVICVEAGLGLNQAFQRVAVEIRHMCEVLTLEIAQMNLEVRAGTPRDQALISLGERTGVEDLRALATMLIHTERFGTSIADSLRIHSETMRTKRQQRAEEAAAKTTIKMVFPLAICIFPALFVVVLGPALMSIVETFSKMGG
jgi:tight adherence protein C